MRSKILLAVLYKIAVFAIPLMFVEGLSAQNITTKSTPSLDFDNLIVPGVRIGPVAMGGNVQEIVSKLGNPKKISRSTYRGYGYDADEVYYSYRGKYDVLFVWEDTGLRPVVENGYRGITTWSEYWVTEKGIHIGSSTEDIERAYGEPDKFRIESDGIYLDYNIGVVFFVKDRNSPVYCIYVMPRNWLNK